MSSIIDEDICFSRQSKNDQDENSPGNDQTTSSSLDKKNLYNLWSASGKKPDELSFAHGSAVEQVLVSSSTGRIYTGSTNFSIFCQEGFVSVFENIDDAIEGKFCRSVDSYQGPFQQAVLLKADHIEHLAATYGMGSLCFYDGNLHPVKRVFVSESDPSNDISANHDSTLLAIANQDRSLAIVDARIGELQNKYHAAMGFPITGVDFVPEQTRVLTTVSEGLQSDFNHILQWDLRAPLPASYFISLRYPTTCLRYSGQNKNLFAVGTLNGWLLFFDIRNPSIEVNSRQILPNEPIIKIKTVDDGKRMIGLYESNKLIEISETASDTSIIETGLPENYMIRDVFEFNSKLYTAQVNSPNLSETNIEIS